MYKTLDELKEGLARVAQEEEGILKVTNRTQLNQEIDQFVQTAVFADHEGLKAAARWSIRALALALDIVPSSIHDLYMAMGREEIRGFTVPAINLRGMTYDVARQVFKLAIEKNIGAFIFEIAKSEIGYTNQRPSEYAACILAAAIKEGFKGPVFIQGDHFQFNRKKFSEDPETEFEVIKGLTQEAIEAGFYNIDIDPSTLVQYSRPTLIEQQRENYECTAKMTAFIRKLEPEGITISVGGEIGHIGGKNSTVEEFEAFMEGYLKTLKEFGDMPGISKISVQTGTAHGGIPLPDGTVAKVNLDFEVLRSISEVARKKYGMSGAVQHGASTLPDELFDKFPEVGTSEIHLATGFQNIIYDHLPEEIKNEIYNYLKQNLKSEWKEDWTEQQFIYKTRKKGFGPFKRLFWDLPQETKSKIMESLYQKFHLLFEKLKVFNTQKYVDKYIKPVKVLPKRPF